MSQYKLMYTFVTDDKIPKVKSPRVINLKKVDDYNHR